LAENLSVDIYERLSLRILKLEYAPGHRLTEEGLCAEFQVSRSPVREALNMLVQRGLVKKNPRQNYAVRELELKEIRDAYHVRLVLELEVVSLLCKQELDHAFLDRLEARWTELRDGLPDLFIHAAEEDEHFHHALAEATGNSVLAKSLAAIDWQIHFVRLSDITNLERLAKTCVDHLEIINAVRRRDLKNALIAISRNIEWAESNVESALKAAKGRQIGKKTRSPD
jgi:DNA-binding GntR family transcriptional regulator